jgi:hypothetical protein
MRSLISGFFALALPCPAATSYHVIGGEPGPWTAIFNWPAQFNIPMSRPAKS